MVYPFSWMFSHLRGGLKWLFIDNFNKTFLVTLPNFLFGFVGACIIIYGFKNIKEDTTSLTNYGFAILAGIASICFSWTRGLDQAKEPSMIARISKAGESSLHCAILFLLASALKYGAIHLDTLIPKSWKIIYTIVGISLTITYSVCFTLGFYKVDRVLCDINKLLYERIHKDARN